MMSATSTILGAIEPGTLDLFHTATALDVLERLSVQLQERLPTATQIRLVLEAVKTCTAADAVCWCAAATREIPDAVVDPPQTRQDCTFVLAALEQAGPDVDGQVLPPLDAGPIPAGDTPSVAVLRISRTQSTWLAAVRWRHDAPFHAVDLKFMELARRILLNQRRQLHAYEQLKEAVFGMVQSLTAAMDAKDPYTCGHNERVARIGLRLARQMGLAETLANDIYLAGLLHDIGKIGVREEVLLKEGPLTDEEFLHIQQHVVTGDRLLSTIKPLHHLRPGVRHHHERWDGAGYPDGLKGEEIPLMARVLAAADACDAMMSARPYRRPLAPDQIDAVLREGSGTQWDPQLIEPFLACRHDLYDICSQGVGQSFFHAVEQALCRDEGVSSLQSLGRASRRIL